MEEIIVKGFVNGYYKIAIWITRFAYVNLLWLGFTVAGLGILGLLPATAGMFAVVRKWVLGETDIPVYRLFWTTYKKEFLKVNLLGGTLFIVFYLLTIQFQILRSTDGVGNFIASYVVLTFFVILFMVLLYVFPIYAHFNLKVLENLKWSLIIGIIHPILTIFLIIVVVALNYATFLFMPGLLFFFGGSVTAFILMWGVSHTFSKYEESVTPVIS